MNYENPIMLENFKEKTPARIGAGRCGSRPATPAQLAMRADHAAAKDTVLTDVDSKWIERMGFFTVQTMCKDKLEYLRRPDLGRRFSEEALSDIRKKCKFQPRIQLYVADGLSSQAIEANVEDGLPAIRTGISKFGLELGTPFFVKYGRVATEDYISEVLDSEVTCVLIGERPGLSTAQSMSAYIVYRGTVGMPESRRTVVSNIHSNGFPPAEAGAYIAELMVQMLEKKVSGVAFKR